MTDILASLGIKAEMSGFARAIRDLDSFGKNAETAQAKTKNFNAELAGLSQTIRAFVKDSQDLRNASSQTHQAMGTGTKVIGSHAKAYERLADAIKRASQAAASGPALPAGAGAAAGGTRGGGGHGGGGMHGFLSASSSGLHAGVIGAIPPQIGAMVIAAEMAIGPVKALFGAIVDGVGAALDASMKLDQVRAALSVLGPDKVAQNMDFVLKAVDKLALPLVETTMAYAKLGAAAGENNAKQEAAKHAFMGVATAARALHLSAGDTSGAIKALVDMFSKGQVMSEELKKQLGNRVPGAMRIAGEVAKQMGLDLNEALTKGVLKGEKATEFIKLFGDELVKNFGGAAGEAAHNLASSLIRIENSLILLGDAVSRTGLKDALAPVMGAVADGVKAMTQAVEDFSKTPAGKDLYDTFLAVGDTVGALIKEFGTWFTQMDSGGSFVKVLREELEKLAPFLTVVVEGFKALLLQFKATADFKAGNFKAGIASMQEANAILGGVSGKYDQSKHMVAYNEQRRAAERQQREYDEARRPAGATVVVEAELPKASKEAEALAKRQDEYLRRKEEEIKLQDILGEKTSNYIQQVKQLVALKLASVSVDERGQLQVKAGAAAQPLLAHAQKLDELQKQKEENIASQKAAEKAEAELQSFWSSVRKESGDNWGELYDAQLKLDVGLNRGVLTVQQYTDGLTMMKEKFIESYRAGIEGQTMLQKLMDKWEKHVRTSWDRKGGGQDWAQQEKTQLFVWRAQQNSKNPENRKDTNRVYFASLEEIRRRTDETYKAVAETAEGAADRVGSAVFDMATKQIRGWKDLREGMKAMIADILADIAKLIIKMTIMKPIMDYLRGGGASGWMGTVAGWLGSSGTTAAASGGTFGAGTPLTVGERGPEKFIPMTPGTVVPNGTTQGNGPITIQVNIDNKGNDTAPADAQASGNALGARLRAMVVEEMHNQSRTGGHLWRMQQGRA